MNIRKSLFSGIFVPIITPFTFEGRIFEESILSIFDYLHNHHIDKVWLMGSYGAFPLLSEDERKRIAEVALKKAHQLNITVIVNVSSLYTDMATRLAHHAYDNGADGVASVVPFYYATSHYRTENIFHYFKAIVETTSLPVFFYNNEQATGYKPSYKFFKQLIDIGVHGFKSKGDYIDMSAQLKTINKNSSKSVYLSGSTSVHLQGYLLGADGVTSGVALALPKLVTKLQKSLENNDIQSALRFQNLVLEARDIMGRYVGRAVACYDILQHKKVNMGTCRSPWLRMNSVQAKEVIEDLAELERLS